MYNQFKMGLGIYGAACLLGLASAWLSGCGDYDGQPGDEIGTVEQPYQSKVQTNFQWGATTASARLACNKTSSGQVCTIPSARGGSFYVLDLSSSNRTIVRNVFSSINSAVGSTPWLEEIDVADRLLSTVVFASGAVSGSLSSNIDGYSSLSLFHEFDLTEGVVAGDPVGSYKAHDNVNGGGPFPDTITIDFADCDAKFPGDATAQLQCKRHAIGHAVLAHMGLGSRTDSAGGVGSTWQRRTLAAAGTVLSALNSGGVCLYNSANYTNNGDYSIVGLPCSD
jgi:hypothetical protein